MYFCVVKIHEKYITRCLELAKNGLVSTRPNPAVGCVIVYNEKIIGEGYTSPYGGNHAEVNAIESVLDKSLLKESTLYVSLEPCSHFGKTPPCSDLIIKYKLKKVVVGCLDENSLVNGKGIQKLKDHQIEVEVGVLEEQCRELNKRFFHFHKKKQPYIVLKWAQTKDGFIDGLRKEDDKLQPTWISNKHSQQLVHKWRSEEQSIMVGTNTVIKDNPRLNVRSWYGENPIRLVLDNTLRIPKDFYVFDGSIKTIVFTSSKINFDTDRENVEIALVDYSKSIPQQICDYLYQQNIQSVLIEGGAQTIRSFVFEGFWNEARIFIGDVAFGSGIKAPEIDGEVKAVEKIDSDILKIITPIDD